ncbi:PREDICTED: hemojuvelin-like [Thamnophis sirtalis]|uniref:Hemojuvelin-like n=1 Tax=Thamnophis sirtalis TaxID=35019 RepID=A0A6I9YQ96_9SAUR|nr:PREDICTED: hemojuvelin-like [Thamnophis sirtalis]XP_013925851.1 PREDICTED: hemojuvelin-like [Thamnophis sirtalis]
MTEWFKRRLSACCMNPLYLMNPSFFIKLLVLLLLYKHVDSQCKISRCNSEFIEATADMHDSERSTAYCNALRDYSSCTRRTSRTCRGDLAYHTAVYVIEDLIIQNNCSRDSPTTVPKPPALSPNKHDYFPSTDTCDYEKSFIHKHGQSPTYQYCAVFGDPHVRTVNDEFHTCRVEGSWPLLDNNNLFVQATSYPIIKGSNVTGIGKLTIIFKNMKECIEEKVYQAEMDNLPVAFADGSVNGGEKPGGNSLTIHEHIPGQHITIQATYIGTTIAVRQVGKHLSFSIRIAKEIATSFTDEQDLQLCMSGCFLSQRISIHNCCRPKGSLTRKKARLLCKEKLPVEDIYFQSCVFDVMTSGDVNFTQAAQKALEDARALHPDSKKIHIFHSNRTSYPCSSSFLLLILTILQLYI